MNPSVLFIVSSDPRTSARPAEAIRIAAGVGTWKKADVSLYLRGAAVLALSEYPDELIDEDNYTRYFPIVGEFGRPIYVEKGAPLLSEIGEAPLRYEEISDEQLARLAAAHKYIGRF
jgi:sulfur relay (sulfurtransferase) DsrF/TusC family protein